MNRNEYVESLIKGGVTPEQAEELAKGAFADVDPADAAVDAAEAELAKGSQVDMFDDDGDDDGEDGDDDDDDDCVVPTKAKKAMKGLVRGVLSEMLEPLVAAMDEQVGLAKGQRDASANAFGASLAAYTAAATELTKGVRALTEKVTAIEAGMAAMTKGLSAPLPPKGVVTPVGTVPHPSEVGNPGNGGMEKGSPAWFERVHSEASRRGAVATLRAIEARNITNIIAAAKADGINAD